MTNISLYKNTFEWEISKDIPFDIFLENIRDGYWQDYVLPVRRIEDKKVRDELKLKCPGVTISGKFKTRRDNDIVRHSGYIVADFDKIPLEEIPKFRKNLEKDPYVFACFLSISGRGLCVIFKIKAEKHREAFQGICEYVWENYKQIVDQSGVNESRFRYVSYDPEIYIASNAETFTRYPKEKAPTKLDKAIFAPDDFQHVLNQILDRKIDITGSYNRWLRIGFGLCHQFKDDGRQHFHLISQFAKDYEYNDADKQYDNCLAHSSKNEATIAMFYYYAKEAGLEIYSERTKKIAYSAIQGKKAGLDAKTVCQNLKDFLGIEGAEDIVNQVMLNDIQLNEDTIIEQFEIYMKQNYQLRRNEVTRFIETEGIIIEQKDFNSIWIKAKKIFPPLNYEIVDRLINSDFVKEYNPFTEFFEKYKHLRPTGCIEKVLGAIQNRDSKYLLHFGKKWLVSLISAVHGQHSPLMLILLGKKQGTGKTEWFRRLLPSELKNYYAESKLDEEKDGPILMTQKWVIMDDEMGGKSKKEAKRIKELTSKAIFSLREPYGRHNVDLKRLAVLCGTTNDNEILSDPTGNRRMIPIMVDSINFAMYNSVDKVELIMEAYWLWKEGFDWQVTGEDIDYLRQDEGMFKVSNLAGELVQQFFRVPEEKEPYLELTCTQIKTEIEHITQQKVVLDQVAKELQSLGFEQVHRKEGKSTKRVYLVVRKDRSDPTYTIIEPAPF